MTGFNLEPMEITKERVERFQAFSLGLLSSHFGSLSICTVNQVQSASLHLVNQCMQYSPVCFQLAAYVLFNTVTGSCACHHTGSMWSTDDDVSFKSGVTPGLFHSFFLTSFWHNLILA